MPLSFAIVTDLFSSVFINPVINTIKINTKNEHLQPARWGQDQNRDWAKSKNKFTSVE